MLSLFIAYFVTSLLYQERITNLVEEILITNGKKFIQTYESAPSANLIPFMQNFSGLTGNLLQLYNKDGKPLLDEKNGEIQVDPIYIKTVLAGDIARDINKREPYPPIIGLPFQVDGEPYALFLTVEKNSIEEEIMNSIHIMYIIILFFGSFLILVAARYFVNPILRLTDATKNMAKGKFDFELHTKRKDEIGLLTVSFNEMAKELAKLDRMRQDFVSNVSHEIQSPLTSISGFTKALKQKKMSEESRLHYLTIIEEECERLSRLSENLLRLSYLQQETHPLKVRSYRLDEQLRKVVIALEPQWAAKEIEIDLQLEAMRIQADEDQLYQVWINLLSNSIKFTPKHGKIYIEAAMKEDQNVVSITDNGPGIPEEEQEDIFTPFYKVDKSRNNTVKGNGLGLSIVKKIVDIHNGNIKVSGRLGEGATFTVKLPK
ncbi:sensor histidine kinase [Bacillus methanolicus]|uniref:Heme sensor protein HssS n=1 Tax=Bacillus methanolicus (strain MGA3 / ATCC 53907) TaxID=796606 RepID=I3E896_BACMM|nr:HAMP domain-containing sensor histidine kinase [Bacillus methanolicus]AIE59991.1 two-component sensor histidine kinase [Bacillus methanolicus MGA3]EIJ82717.1 two-component sensor histidine kinase [Bacillus methanolicus MGA3]